ncbi:MAG: ester cyclase [Anaerolineales bacterium]|jgi:steroid delta-isomerase-like uncharacterized protein
MTPQENLNIVRRFLEEGKIELMREDATFRDFTLEKPVVGRETISELINNMYNVSFPGAQAEFRNVIAGEESVVLEFTFRGVHRGELMGIPPTGNTVEIPMCAVYDLKDGMIQRGRLYYDGATMASQLGLTAE